MNTCPHCDAPNQTAARCEYCGGEVAGAAVPPQSTKDVTSSTNQASSPASPADSGEFVVAPVKSSNAAAVKIEVRSPSVPVTSPRTVATTSPTKQAPPPIAVPAGGIVVPSAANSSVRIPEFQPTRVPASPTTSRPSTTSTAPPTTIVTTSAPAPSASVQIPLRTGPLRWESWRRTINVSARKLEMPPQCACCLRDPTGNVAASHVKLHGTGASRGSEKSWMFPICGSCQQHIRAGRRINTKAKAAAGFAFVIPIAGCSLIGFWWVGVIIGAVTGGITWLVIRHLQLKQIASMASPTCACLGPAVRFDGFHGTVQTFRFANEHYAQAFEQENASKVV